MPIHDHARRHVVERIAAITRRTPPHLRPRMAALAVHARGTLTTRLGAGAERVLGELASASMADEAWLRAVGTFGELHARAKARADQQDVSLRALIILVPR
jgi:hypothetical protein